MIDQYWLRVQATTSDYESACEVLMEKMAGHEAQADSVRFLLFRLDFNEFYLSKRNRGTKWAAAEVY